jgi:hypothetical protein
MTTEAKPPEWAWCWDGSDTAHGPFANRESAIANACAEALDDERDGIVGIGTCLWSSLDYFLSVLDPDSLQEQADEYAYDNEFGWYDDTIFELNVPPGGKRDQVLIDRAALELREFVRPWAEKWITVTKIFSLEEHEQIRVKADGTWEKVVGK